MTSAPAAPRAADIAIVGMACMFPRAPDLEAFWANILGKVNAIGQPVDEWGAERHFHPDDPDRSRVSTTAGGFLGDLYAFDGFEFGIMPNSLDGGEPDQFLALKVAHDALVDAGYLKHDHTRTGVILGHSTYLHRGQANVVQHAVTVDQTLELIAGLLPEAPGEVLERLREAMLATLPGFNADIAAGLVPNVMTGRIANRLDLKGPNYIIDAACASSLLAVGAAMEELRRGDSDLMIAGGVNASMPAEVLAVFTQLGALSSKGAPRPFDARADGTLLGEGLGAVVLKRLDDARRDGDRVYAVIRAVGHSSDGRALGLLAPNLEGEVLAMQRAYGQVDVPTESIGLIEAHGTGIPLGDKTEMAALTRVFGEREGLLPTAAIGSVKSMISHTIPAAGIAGLIKMALSLHHRVLPPTLCDELNPALNFERTRFFVNTERQPWVKAPGEPRRAAVNAFGFGGINTHAVIEEYTDDAPETSALPEWASELVVAAGEDRDALLAAVSRLREDCDRPGVRLRDLAFTASQRAGGGPERLALVVNSVDQLRERLDRALARLEDRARDRFQTRTGMFFAAAPLPGRLAFMFPGEGAQYHGMLGELALAFPSVRGWFDFWDGIFAGERDLPCSRSVFLPPNSLGDSARETLSQQLHTLRTGSQSVFIANLAIFELLRACGIEPDAMVGHSTGENSALFASGMIPGLADREALRQHVLRLNRMYDPIESSDQVASGSLLTVGAVPREEMLEVLAECQGEVHLALDNCLHQSVLFGPTERMEALAERLRRRGGLCAFLPFDRAYHTPLFAPVAELVGEFFQDIDFQSPLIPVYSCASASQFPEQAQAMRELATVQWSSTVRFIDTVEAMYEDGFRHFVEVGPSSNLTSFVDDILRDRDHTAGCANNRGKADLGVFLQLLGRLFVAGRDPRWERLFAGRGAESVDGDGYEQRRTHRPRPLKNTLPYVRLAPAQLEALSRDLHAALQAAPAEAWAGGAPAETSPGGAVPIDVDKPSRRPAGAAHTGDADGAAGNVGSVSAQTGGQEPEPAADGGGSAPASDPGDVVREHLALMHAFLQQQERVMAADPAALHDVGATAVKADVVRGAAMAGAAPASDGRAWQAGIANIAVTAVSGGSLDNAAASAAPLPFLTDILAADATYAEARFDLDLAHQRFLQHHMLYSRQVSELDPQLGALPVSPLAVSLEMMAEIASLLSTAPLLVAMENVQAYNWVAADQGHATVVLKARSTEQTGRVQAWLEDSSGLRLIEGEVCFAEQLPAEGACVDALPAPRIPLTPDHELYTTGMFHGPVFQSVASLLAWDESGMDARLADTSSAGFFADEDSNGFLLNPILLDATGQVTAYWLAQSLGSGFSSFPSSIARIDLLQGAREDTSDCVLRGRLRFVDGDASNARFLTGDFDCIDAQGRALFRIEGWRDIFFRVPETLYDARSNPRDNWFGEDWSALFPEAGDDAVVWMLPAFPPGLLDDAGALWRRILAFTVLSAEERAQWHALTLAPAQANQWLLGRLALKESVRYWMALQHDCLLSPADIIVRHDESGRPFVATVGLELPLPAVSLAHVGETCMAAVAPADTALGVDLELAGRVDVDELLRGGLTRAEQGMVREVSLPEQREDLALRLWCAKEAAAKSVGTGFEGSPGRFEVRAVDAQSHALTVWADGREVPVVVCRHEDMVVALARCGTATLAA
jgi:acyl transferase domain-containing protein/phosphopantetheinyl transferase